MKKKKITLSLFEKDWNPRDYLNEFYINTVVADELEAVKYQVSFFKKLKFSPLMLEFGCGPTLHRAITAAKYVSEIHVSDYLESNLEEVRKWVEKKPGRFNWNHYVKYILQLEGNKNPVAEDIAFRKEITRQKITKYFKADAGDSDPLGKKYAAYYPLVLSYFCADSATRNKHVWRKFMRNIFSLVKVGGLFTTAALYKSKFYTTGNYCFPSADIDEHDLHDVLTKYLKEINMKVCHLPEHKNQGYEGILLAHGVKR